MSTYCPFKQLDNGWWECPQCGYVFKGECVGPPNKHCDNPPDLTPLLVCLVEFTNHPEILDNPQAYGRAVQQWAAGLVIYGPSGAEACRVEPFETRTDSEVEFIQGLCRENVCKKHQDGVCKPSCGLGMIVEVMARMATEGCPWTGKGGLGPRW